MNPKPHPKPTRKPIGPNETDDTRRPNRPIGPGSDAEHPVDEPPDEHARRKDDPQSRDWL